MRIALSLFFAALLLTACGGGDPDPAPPERVDPPPLNCADHPERCK